MTTQNNKPLHPVKPSEIVVRFRWSPTQILVLGIGVFLAVLGGVGLTRQLSIGIDSLVDPLVAVGWWSRTPLMAVIELLAGLVLVVAGAQTPAPRIYYRIIGGISLVFGLVMAIQPASFDDVLGAGRNSGWLYLVIGAILAGIGFGAPIVFERERIEEADSIGDNPVNETPTTKMSAIG